MERCIVAQRQRTAVLAVLLRWLQSPWPLALRLLMQWLRWRTLLWSLQWLFLLLWPWWLRLRHF